MIYFLEDDDSIRKLVIYGLESQGFAAEGFSLPSKFWRAMEQQPAELVLLDIMLPGLDGYGVCEIIRRESSVPVIILTALDDERSQVKAFELKADDYITKPFSLKLVLMRVEAVLRRSRETRSAPGAEVFRRGDVELDAAGHYVRLNGKDVTLTPTEYALLELFMRNPGRVFTRDNLLSSVWGYDFAGDEKTVNIHIMNLRRKLGAGIIETVRGVGYRLG